MKSPLSLGLALLLLTLTADARPPNVIFILTDDQGWGDAKFAGHPYVKTPNLDRLAKEGTWLRQFYVAATVCSPSRARKTAPPSGQPCSADSDSSRWRAALSPWRTNSA